MVRRATPGGVKIICVFLHDDGRDRLIFSVLMICLTFPFRDGLQFDALCVCEQKIGTNVNVFWSVSNVF